MLKTLESFNIAKEGVEGDKQKLNYFGIFLWQNLELLYFLSAQFQEFMYHNFGLMPHCNINISEEEEYKSWNAIKSKFI